MAQNTILIIDDDHDARLLVSEIAHLAGFEAASAGTFLEAQRILQDGVAAVLLDLVMPDQLCIRIAAFMADESSGTPAILMSGAPASDVARMRHKLVALGLNVVATLAKPFWIDALLEAMAQAIPHPSAAIGLQDEAIGQDDH
jgi:DNA-binding NtrC family response regulator